MPDKITKITEALKAVADPNRIKILKLLAANEKLCVGMIARKLAITQPAVSQHLKVLKNAGLVESNKIGLHVHYWFNMTAITRLTNDLKSLFVATGKKD
jgi:ArsR family transcriptional regulator, arsenate/arsenite/antimonite-responsive transcriptional repressor